MTIVEVPRRTSRPSQGGVVAALVSCALGVGLLLVGSPSLGTPSAALVTATTLFTVPLFVAVGRATGGVGQGFLRFNIGPWYLLALTLGFLLTSYEWVRPSGEKFGQVGPESLGVALWVVLGGLGAWTAGYLISASPTAVAAIRAGVSAAAGKDPHQRVGALTPLIFYGLGVAGYLMQLATGRFGYLSDPQLLLNSPSAAAQFVGSLSDFTKFGIALGAVSYFQRRTVGAAFRLGVMLAMDIFFGLLAGHKSDFLFTVAAVVIVVAAVNPKMVKRWLLVGFVGFLFVAQFVTSYRTEVRPNSSLVSGGQAAAYVPNILGESFAAGPLNGAAASGLDTMSRMREIENVGIIIQKTPEEIPHEGLMPLLAAPVLGFVPRAIWVDKPILATGYDFNQDYYGVPASVRSSAAVTTPGDLLRHLGIPGLLLGMFAIGLFMRLLDSAIHPTLDIRYVFVYLVTFLHFIDIEAGAVALIAELPKLVVVALLATFLAFRRAPRKND